MPFDSARHTGAEQSGGPFVGRSAELRELRALASTIAAEGPAGAVVVGTPGLGKSRLLAEVVRTLEWPCLRIQGYQNARDIALGAAGGLLRELSRIPRVGERLDALLVGEAGRPMAPEFVRLFEMAFRCVLEAGPLGIVADDLQWTDRETLSLLHYLVVAANSTGTPLFVLCASRPAPGSTSFAAQCADAFPTERFTQIELGPLDKSDGVQLLNSLAPGLGLSGATELWHRASGSPFWMTALAADHASGDDTRRSLQHVIRTRCANLSLDPAALFTLLLVAAQPLSVDGIGELLGWLDDRVRGAAVELVNRALVLQDGAAVSIAHDLIRETASRELAEDVRVRMHDRLARWLEASAGENVRQLSRALEHRVASGFDGDELALRIARSPQRRLVGNEGLIMLGQIADAAGGAQGQALQEQVAALASEIGDWATALERWSALADRAASGAERAGAALAAAGAALKLGRAFEVHAYAAVVRELAGGDPALSIEADCMDAQSLLWLEGLVGEAQPLVEHAMAAAKRLVEGAGGTAALGDRESAAYVRAVRVNLDAAIRRADAGTVRQCAELIQRAARDPAEVLAAASDGVFSMLQFEGLPRSAEPRARRALEESRRLTMPSLEVEAIHWVGWIAHHLGHLDEASDLLRQTVALAERVGAPRRFTVPQLRAVLHSIEASRTDFPSNIKAIEGLIAAEADPHFRLVIRTLHIGLVGRFSAPRASELDSLMDAISVDAAVAGCGRCLWESTLQAAEASARIGSPAAAEDAVGRWDATHPDPRPGGPAARRAYVEALLAARRDPGASATHFAEAAQAAESVGYRLMRLWIDLDAAAAVAHLDRTAAVRAFEQAARESEGMGARSELQLAEARLRGLGVHTWRRGPTTSPATLSQRERDIAEAVARGATNPEIATSLFLSRKTVERHVSHILAKLGVRNRAELAALLAHEDEGAAG